jgi:hypothetical protein
MPFQRFDLGDDCAGALVNERPRRFRGAGKMPLQTFGRQLDRGQGILDLVREPPCHLTPCRNLLRPDER